MQDERSHGLLADIYEFYTTSKVHSHRNSNSCKCFVSDFSNFLPMGSTYPGVRANGGNGGSAVFKYLYGVQYFDADGDGFLNLTVE